MEGAGPGDRVWLAAVAQDYPDGLQEEVRATIELLSQRVDREPGDNGLDAWELRHRLAARADVSGAEGVPEPAPAQGAGSGVPPPPPPPVPSPSDPSPPPPPPAPSDPPAAGSDDPSNEDPWPGQEDPRFLVDAVPLLVERELGVLVVECAAATPGQDCYELRYETAYEAGVRVRLAGTQAGTWDVHLLLATDGRASSDGWRVVERWSPGDTGSPPIWAETG